MLPCPSAGDLPDPEIKPTPPTLQADSLPLIPLGSPWGGLGEGNSAPECKNQMEEWIGDGCNLEFSISRISCLLSLRINELLEGSPSKVSKATDVKASENRK